MISFHSHIIPLPKCLVQCQVVTKTRKQSKDWSWQRAPGTIQMRAVPHLGVRDQVSGHDQHLTVWDGVEWRGVEWGGVE